MWLYSSSSPSSFIVLLLITLAIFTPATSATRLISSDNLNYYSTLNNIPLSTTSKMTEFTVNIPYNQEALVELYIDSTSPYQALYQQSGTLLKLNGQDNKFYINSKEILGTEISIKLVGKTKKQQSNGSMNTYSVFVIPLNQNYACAFDCYGNGECKQDNQCKCNEDYIRDTYCQKRNEYSQQKDENKSTLGKAHQLFRRSPGVNELAFNEIFRRNDDQLNTNNTNSNQESSKTAQNNSNNDEKTIIPVMETASSLEAQPVQSQQETIELRDQRNRRTLQNSQESNTNNNQGIVEFFYQQPSIVLFGILAIGIVAAMIILGKLKKQQQRSNAANQAVIYSV